MHAQHIHPCAKLVHTVNILTPLRGLLVSGPRIVQHSHGECMDEMREAKSDSPKSKNADGASGEVVSGVRRYLFLPVPSPQRTFGEGEMSHA